MKKRNSMNLRGSFLGMLLVMAFMIIGAQQATAQFLPVEDALKSLGTEITVLQNSTTADFAGLEVDAPESKGLQSFYYEGVGVEIKKTRNVQNAIDANHAAFLDKFPTASAKADQYRTEVEDLLAQ